MNRLRYGIDATLEEEADRILRDSFLLQPDPVEKAKILTKWMLGARYNREVYVTEGVPDGKLRRGNFHRVLNPVYPHLNAVEGVAQPLRRVPRSSGPDE